MTEDLPTEFDLVVVGTGFTESCIAAGASRIGKTVLHLDVNEFYGGTWASFNLENLISLLDMGNVNDEIRNASYEWHIPAATSATAICVENQSMETNDMQSAGTFPTQSEVLNESRRFNLDLTPKILYSTGKLVELLLKSNICRYAEFRAIDHICTMFHGNLINVPCSRSDVFNSKDLNIVEKRLLMKVLNDCLVYGEEKHDEDALKNRGKTFREYLSSQNVSEKISTCIMQAIAMCNDESSFEIGMERTKLFLNSLARYGNTPFIFPMYGCGEIPQCFCRLCAVFGGIYCLKTRISDMALQTDTNVVDLMLENGSRTIQAKHVVSSHGSLPPTFLERQRSSVYGQGTLVNSISRGLFIASSPLGDKTLNSGGGGVNVLRLVSGQREAFVFQLSHYSGTCPKDYYVFHITSEAESDYPAKDLEDFMKQIFTDKPNSPKVLFSAFFTLTERRKNTTTTDDVIPVYCTAAPFFELDYDKSIENAHDIFKRMYPTDDFLPRAPDPEEIIIEGEDPRALNEVSLPEDLRAQLQEIERSAEEMEIDDKSDEQ